MSFKHYGLFMLIWGVGLAGPSYYQMNYATMGDSYASGVTYGYFGSTDWDSNSDGCMRINHAYTVQLFENFPQLSTDGSYTVVPDILFPACSGSQLVDMVYGDENHGHQIQKAGSNNAFITMQAGGNQQGNFFNIANECFFTPFTNHGPLYPDPSSPCTQAINNARNYITGPSSGGSLYYDLNVTLHDVLNTESAFNQTYYKLYVLGYAHFFNIDSPASDWCNNLTISVVNIGPTAYLTNALRTDVNTLVTQMNSVIEQVVTDRNNPNLVYVSITEGFNGHRLCEEGGYTAPNLYQSNVWFWLATVFSINNNATAQAQLNQTWEAAYYSNPPNETLEAQFNWTDILQVQDGPNAQPPLQGMTSGSALRPFHPKQAGHQAIFEILSNQIVSDFRGWPFISSSSGGGGPTTAPTSPLEYNANTPKGQAVKAGTELRILTVGDSITVGYRSDQDGGNASGYRAELQSDLSADKSLFVGSQSPENGDGSITANSQTIPDDYYGAWSGKTIAYIAANINSSLELRPNIILLHAGTNDVNPNPSINQGSNATIAAQRLGSLIDQMISICPDATILVAMIINTCEANQEAATQQYQQLIPGVVKPRAQAGHRVATVDFTTFPTSLLHQDDCIHPTNQGYSVMGDYWYSFMHQIPTGWINPPVGADPTELDTTATTSSSINDNGGPDPNIPPPVFGPDVIQKTSQSAVAAAAAAAGSGGAAVCNSNPHWQGTGEIAPGVGHNGNFVYTKNWVQAGELAEGIHLGSYPVHLADINGDGKADYLWVNPDNGQLVAWINNLPGAWSPAGTSGGVIADGAGAGDTVVFADMNGDGFADYLVVDGDNGAVTCYWNYGADSTAEHGWRFVPGGIIATGVPHANLDTLRFPDIDGDGRADYVIMGVGGSLRLWLNEGQPGGQNVLFLDQGGIATGASSNLSNIVFADIDGDGRDDYLVWDSNGGLSGFLNQRTEKEGLPYYVNQGGPGSIAGGIGQDPGLLRLADLDGDGKADYVYVDTQNGALWVWWNRGTADTSMAADGLHFADIDGDGLDDYIWLDAASGAPTVYLNKGPSMSDNYGWAWLPLNGGNPIASGAAPAKNVQFGDINGDGRDDYLVLDPVSGALTAYLNGGIDSTAANGFRWNPIGEIATGLGPGANTRMADIDGDGFVDYIQLDSTGGANIYLNQFASNTPNTDFRAAPMANPSGIGQRPEEISFYDINGDGKADYIWTRELDGAVFVWLNNYPNLPVWQAKGQIASGVGVSGINVKWATLQATNRSSYVAVNPSTNAIAAWLNGCDSPGAAFKNANCQEQSTDTNNRWGFNIDVFHGANSCTAMNSSFFSCINGAGCTPSVSNINCNYNNNLGVAGTFDTDIFCTGGKISGCFESVYSITLPCHS